MISVVSRQPSAVSRSRGLGVKTDRCRLTASSRGMTLIEIMVVMVLVSLVLVAVVFGSGQLSSTRLKHTTASLAGAVRVAFTRATATSKSVRIVFDLDNQTMWLEEGDVPMLVQTKDITGTGGADPVTEAEKRAVLEGERIIKGPQAPRAHFRAIEAFGAQSAEGGKGPRKLERGITFREIQTSHDSAAHKEGRAYLYFWPGGRTERASIQLRVGKSEDDADTLTLLVSPLTGKVTVKNGPIPVPNPHDEKEASEREESGF
jgi:general secretion pathway protein H